MSWLPGLGGGVRGARGGWQDPKFNGTTEATGCRAFEVILRTLNLTLKMVAEKYLGTELLESSQTTGERRSQEIDQEASVIMDTRDDRGRTQHNWDKGALVSSDVQSSR